MNDTYTPPTGYEPDSADNHAYSYDDRDFLPLSEDEPESVYVPIKERPENTHMGYGGDDPAIDDTSDVATWDGERVA